MKTNRIVEVAVKVIVAALTAFLTAITTTSCMGHHHNHELYGTRTDSDVRGKKEDVRSGD